MPPPAIQSVVKLTGGIISAIIGAIGDTTSKTKMSPEVKDEWTQAYASSKVGHGGHGMKKGAWNIRLKYCRKK